MRLPRRVFIDSSGYFAVVNSNDEAHPDASAILERCVRERVELVTTNAVVVELHALVLSRINHRVAYQVISSLEASASTRIERVSVGDEQRAREILKQYLDKDFSLTDALSFAVMERLQLSFALTLDHHFAQYGFITLPILK